MVLVGYSDSEDSGNESPAPAPSPPLPKLKATAKPPIPSIVDRSNPHKVRVNLPAVSRADAETGETDGPPPKRARTAGTGGGLFADFNAMLPAPKNLTAKSGSGAAAAKRLGKGVSLKTGAAPSFSREVDEHHESLASDLNTATGLDSAALSKPEEVKLVGNVMMFKPLSIAGKKKKKTSLVAAASAAAAAEVLEEPKASHTSEQSSAQTTTIPQQPATATPPKKKSMSLFSLASDDTPTVSLPVVEEDDDDANEFADSTFTAQPPSDLPPAPAEPSAPSSQNAQTLSSIASDLNLSASAKRQLFGRQSGRNNTNSLDASTISVVNYSTEREYATGEALRAAGETVQNRPVKTIAPGKHNLKQLVSNAVGQADALEDMFAQGRRNRKEAGNKYGW